MDTDVEQNHGGFCAAFLTLKKHAFVLVAFWTLVVRPGKRRVLCQVLRHPGGLTDLCDELVFVNQGVARSFRVHAVSTRIQQLLVHSVFPRIEHVVAVQAEAK